MANDAAEAARLEEERRLVEKAQAGDRNALRPLFERFADPLYGGAHRFAYDVPDGRRMVVGGTFRTIEAPSRIVFSWLIEPPDEHAGIDSEVTVSITPRGASAELIIRHEKFGRRDADLRHEQGWRGALDLLEARLRQAARARLQGAVTRQ